MECLCECWVIDCIGFILDIFVQCVCIYEGKLQVELVQLCYMVICFVCGWIYFERQKGGIGLCGLGEIQFEIDCCLLCNCIMQILLWLEKVEKQCEQGWWLCVKVDIFIVLLVGYINVGKLMFFNQIIVVEVYVVNQLFVILDLMLCCIDVFDVGEMVLVDIVGFICYLLYDLVVVFKVMLQEMCQVMLLLYVIDVVDVCVQENIDVVNMVFVEIEVDEILVLLVMNKIDMFDDFELCIDCDDENKLIWVWFLVQIGVGVLLFFQVLMECFFGEVVQYMLCLLLKEG